MKIYMIQTYEYSSYSYSGVRECESFLFKSKERAIEWAKLEGYTIKDYPEKDNEVDLIEFEVIE